MTRKPSRLRRWMKWVGLVGCGVIVLAGVLSFFWNISYASAYGFVSIRSGHLAIKWDVIGASKPIDMLEPHVYSTGPMGEGYVAFDDHFIPRWWLSWEGWSSYSGRAVLPLWTALVLIGSVTAILWYRDHRPRPGHCQRCGYDLTGNVSGRCPECGKMIHRSARRCRGKRNPRSQVARRGQ